MNIVEETVLKTAKVYDNNIIKVDHFLNHQMDVHLLKEISQLFYDYFKDKSIDKIITCEASGIGIAVMCGLQFDVPIVFAKKNPHMKSNPNNYQAEVFSYTKQLITQFNIDKRFLNDGEKVLIVDDFLANGEALNGLISLCDQAQAEICGIGIVIEKGFQKGGKIIRDLGYDLYSLCVIKEIQGNQLIL